MGDSKANHILLSFPSNVVISKNYIAKVKIKSEILKSPFKSVIPPNKVVVRHEILRRLKNAQTKFLNLILFRRVIEYLVSL